MTYKILSAETKTTATGKTYKKATLQGDGGVTLEVSVWSDYSQYNAVLPNSEVEGVIREKGNYKNLVDGNLGRRPINIPYAVKAKQQSIEKSQDRKEEGIKTSSTIRMAVDIVVARMGSREGIRTDVEIENEIRKWRMWLVDNWDIIPTDSQAF